MDRFNTLVGFNSVDRLGEHVLADGDRVRVVWPNNNCREYRVGVDLIRPEPLAADAAAVSADPAANGRVDTRAFIKIRHFGCRFRVRVTDLATVQAEKLPRRNGRRGVVVVAAVVNVPDNAPGGPNAASEAAAPGNIPAASPGDSTAPQSPPDASGNTTASVPAEAAPAVGDAPAVPVDTSSAAAVEPVPAAPVSV